MVKDLRETPSASDDRRGQRDTEQGQQREQNMLADDHRSEGPRMGRDEVERPRGVAGVSTPTITPTARPAAPDHAAMAAGAN